MHSFNYTIFQLWLHLLLEVVILNDEFAKHIDLNKGIFFSDNSLYKLKNDCIVKIENDIECNKAMPASYIPYYYVPQ